jgi:dTDP-L-rhamnose 4-epimerase
MERVLVTGGAGFVGRHLCAELLASGYQVRVLDALLPQVHGADAARPAELSADIEFVQADLRDTAATAQAVDGVDLIVHLAAAVGVGQSMYRVADYVSCNDLGTAVLWQAIIDRPVARPIRRLVVASTMGVYGEGVYRHPGTGEVAAVAPRPREQMATRRWDYETDRGERLVPVPLSESAPITPRSIYAATKWQQEQTCRLMGSAFGIPVTTLRLFNVYGPGQALANPYAGVVAIFAARLLNGLAPELFEDGRQLRDLIEVSDVARAIRLILAKEPGREILHVASGQPVTLCDLATLLARRMGQEEIRPVITGSYRMGDTRHSLADVTAIDAELGAWRKQDLSSGLGRLVEWIREQPRPRVRTPVAVQELNSRGLLVSS